MNVTGTQVTRTEHPEARSHYLEPGDVCTGPGGIYGVVVRSASTSATIVLVKFGEEPIRDYYRDQLLWEGPVE